jgi:hypothetical protein
MDGLTRSNGQADHAPHCDHTQLPPDLVAGYQEVRLDFPTSCMAVRSLFQLAPHQRELRSGGPTSPRAAANPHLQTVLNQPKCRAFEQ